MFEIGLLCMTYLKLLLFLLNFVTNQRKPYLIQIFNRNGLFVLKETNISSLIKVPPLRKHNICIDYGREPQSSVFD